MVLKERLLFLVRVGLRVMEMKGYPIVSKPLKQELHHQRLFSVILRIHLF